MDSSQNLVGDGVANDEVSRVDAAAVRLRLQLVPQSVLRKVLVVDGVRDEDIIGKVPVFRDAIRHPGKGEETELKVLLLHQHDGKETGGGD